jgi:predicted nucleic acid-binding protein
MTAAVRTPRAGLTFDTGALIALERRRDSMRKVFATAITNGVAITVPVVVVTEWWRAGHREKERLVILRSLRVEPLVERVARLAGAALGRTQGAGAIDAIVMASAALRGDTVYTSDPNDLAALKDANSGFASVQVLRC